jgi:DNA-directed RNA polymerase specialized sigma24 family protein
MDQNQRLAEQFEDQRPRLRSVAYRILGSSNEADLADRALLNGDGGDDQPGLRHPGSV